MACPSPLEKKESSQLQLLKGNPPTYIHSHPCDDQDITEEQHLLRSSNESNPGDKSTTAFDHKSKFDDLSQPPLATGITIREASTCHRKKKDKELSELSGRENVLWAWKLELFLFCVAAGLFVAICLILDGYSNQELPNWNMLGLTLNTLISILATFFRATVAVIAFEILAQRKWNWLSHDNFKPMQDVQLFDDASRGVYGCLRLLPLIATREPVALGAVVVAILSLGIGSFTQQSIHTYQCLGQVSSPSDAATIAVANTVRTKDVCFETSWYDGWELKPKIRVAMMDAMVSSNDAGPLFNCTSGNCTFPTYSDYHDDANLISHASVGICNDCIDVYDLVEQEKHPWVKRGIIHSLPVDADGERMKIILGTVQYSENDTYVNVAAGMDLSWTEKVAPPEFLNRARWSIANITLMGISRDRCDRRPDGNITCPHACSPESRRNQTCLRDSKAYIDMPIDYAAAACIMYPCTRYYRAEFNNSKPDEKVVWEVPLRKQSFLEPLWSAEDASIGEWKGIMQPCSVNGTLFTSLNASSSADEGHMRTKLIFHSQDWATEDIRSPSQGLNTTVPADCVAMLPAAVAESLKVEFEDTYNFNCTPLSVPTLHCLTTQDDAMRITSSPLIIDGLMSIQHIKDAMASVATRITNELRKVGRGASSDAQPLVKGIVWGNRACVRIAWKWLIFPGALLVKCAVLLLVTIMRDAKRRNVWKSSILPLLLKDYPGVEKMGLEDFNTAAGNFEVKIET